jgi:hypothetical protein
VPTIIDPPVTQELANTQGTSYSSYNSYSRGTLFLVGGELHFGETNPNVDRYGHFMKDVF